MESYRSLFPITRSHTYLNHAAIAPLCESMSSTIDEYQHDMQAGELSVHKWIDNCDHVRKSAAQLINALPQHIAFVTNVSTAAMMVAQGITIRNDEHLVVPRNQFPANIYPWTNLKAKNIPVKTPVIPHDASAYDCLDDELNEKTKLLAISFVEYDDGFKWDLHKVGEICRRKNILLFVDAVQGAGALLIDVQKTPVDFMAVSGHKWLMGPTGQGFLYIHPNAYEELYPISLGWLSVEIPFDFDNLHQSLRPGAAALEGGSLNLLGIAILGTALDLLHKVGLRKIETQILKLTRHLRVQLYEKNYQIVGHNDSEALSGITSFYHANIATHELYEKLTAERIVVSLRKEAIRVSPHFYNTLNDIDDVIQILES
ncbi:aminotransferase class V-fold PLP-dependent enzyme [candidate division KSB1 bacterium]|nr:aminotransferase class V-fold PLP-dependent enzyme [candidate division KSB1 bacterium]